MGSIELRGVVVQHDFVDLLHDVNLTVAAGEVVALLGSSGSGKTSLLRVVAGHDRVADGQVIVDGEDVTKLEAHERRLGMVAQTAPLQPTRDVEGNLKLPFHLRGDDPVEAQERADREGRRFGLTWLFRRRPDQLSGGQQMATAVARSIVSSPPVLLLDEPAASLDHRTRTDLLREISTVQRSRQAAVLVATNNIVVAETMADRVAVIDRGTIVQAGPLTQLRDAPATLRVADLAHPMPLTHLTATIDPGDRSRRTVLVTDAGTIPTWDTRVRDHDGPVEVAFVPRDLTLTAPDEVADLTGTVRRVATTGHRRLVDVITGAGLVTVDVPGDANIPAPDELVGLTVTRSFVADTDGTVIAVLTRPTS